MAVRRSDEQEATPAPAPAVGTGFFSQVVLFGSILLLGFVGNSYLTNLHEVEQTKTEYRGYKDGVRDVR